MKKTWLCLSLCALLALPLAGCANGKTGSNLGDMTASAAPSVGADMLERAGDGIRDTLDDMGDAARDMGRDAMDAIEG